MVICCVHCLLKYTSLPIGQHLWHTHSTGEKLQRSLLHITIHHNDAKVSQWCKSISRTTDEVFHDLQEKCFLWRRWASLTAGFGLFDFAEPLHTKKYNTLEEREKLKKHNMSPFMPATIYWQDMLSHQNDNHKRTASSPALRGGM